MTLGFYSRVEPQRSCTSSSLCRIPISDTYYEKDTQCSHQCIGHCPPLLVSSSLLHWIRKIPLFTVLFEDIIPYIAYIEPVSLTRLISQPRYGAQPPIEILRTLLDHGFWSNLEDTTRMDIHDVLMVAAMGPPGGGRNHISPRLVR